MKVWLYYRLSRDEDKQLNSLTNQRKIAAEYAAAHGHEIVGESYDDNVSGMHFDREGIEKLQEEADRHSFEAVIVKDLSRLGRHKILTAMFIDHLKSQGVRVLSATEGIDTFNENDDLMIGFKSLINDSYCRDMSRKIRAGYKQKQKSGIVMIPPMGYFKDKNTGKVEIVEEQAKIVRRIYDLYLSGYGLKAIASMLNAEGIPSQGYYQKMMLGKNIGSNKPEIAYRFLWENTRVRRVLTNEFYTGTVVCHRSYTSKIDHVRKELPPEEHFRHENMVPAIIEREAWERVQTLLLDKVKRNVRAAPGQPFHRYTGLITCAECGSSFVCKKRTWRGVERREYVCGGYHRFGRENCSDHRIDEAELDKLIMKELKRVHKQIKENYDHVEESVRRWLIKKGQSGNKLNDLEKQLKQRKTDQQIILLERIRDPERADVYTEMLKRCEEDIRRLSCVIEAIRNYDETIRKRRAEMKKGLDVIDGILKENAVSDVNLRLLIEGIVISEKKKRLHVVITLKGVFRHHLDVYENGEISERFFEASIDSCGTDEGTPPVRLDIEEVV